MRVTAKHVLEAKKQEIDQRLMEYLVNHMARGDNTYMAFARALAALRLGLHQPELRVSILTTVPEIDISSLSNIKLTEVYIYLSGTVTAIFEADGHQYSLILYMNDWHLTREDKEKIEELAAAIVTDRNVRHRAEELRRRYTIKRLVDEQIKLQKQVADLQAAISYTACELEDAERHLKRVERKYQLLMEFIKAKGLKEEYQKYREEKMKELEEELEDDP